MVGLGTVRGTVIGNTDRVATPEEIGRMTTMVERALAEGACGASSGLEYTPGAFASREELAALCRRMMAKKAAERPAYPELIRQLTATVDRLHAHGGSSLPAVSSASERSPPEPTPFVGRGPRAAEVVAAADDDAAATLVRTGDRPDPAWTRAGGAARAVASDPGADDGLDRPATVARWLIAVTAISALVFFVGLGLMLFGPRPERNARAGGPADAAAADAGAARRGPDPEPPEGMFLLRRPDGAPWLFVAEAPVSQAEYAAAQGVEPPKPRGKKPSPPVVSVSYADAESYAAARGMRLLAPDEWAAAAAGDGFTPAGKGLWEWVDDGTRGVQAPRAVRGHPDRTEKMRPAAHANVTFRLARDL